VIAFMYSSLLTVNVNISLLIPKSREKKYCIPMYAYRQGAHPGIFIRGVGGGGS